MRTIVGLAAALVSAVGAVAQPIVEGLISSPVRVVIYEDLQCSDCARFRAMLDEKLLPRYGAKVAFQHRDFPLAKHAWARKAAVAARYFQQVKPELGIDYRREVMAHIAEITAAGFEGHLAKFAASRGVDAPSAIAALHDAKLAALVEKDYQDGVARGVAKTPTVFVDGNPFIETFTVEEISAGIDRALAAAK